MTLKLLSSTMMQLLPFEHILTPILYMSETYPYLFKILTFVPISETLVLLTLSPCNSQYQSATITFDDKSAIKPFLDEKWAVLIRDSYVRVYPAFFTTSSPLKKGNEENNIH
jgi:hypothetical protein